MNAERHTLQWISPSPRRTIEFGRRLAGTVRPGDVVALVGPLGAGKTQLVRGIAAGLGVDEAAVSSPTFVLMCEYEGRPPVVHVDAYRMEGLSDLESIGWSEELLGGAVTIVEWADRIRDHMPDNHLEVELQHTGPQKRTLTLRPHGVWSKREPKLRELLAGMTRTRPCPTCGGPAPVDADSFPFCSSRCRMADLNRWLSGDYRISTPLSGADELGGADRGV